MDHILPYIPYVTAFAGLLSGILLTVLGIRYRSNGDRARAEERIRTAEKSIADLEAGSAHLEAELQKARQSEASMLRHQGELEALARSSRKANEEKQALLEAAEKRLATTFETLSKNALQTSQEEFVRYAREAIAAEKQSATEALDDRHAQVETIVKPVAESLEKVQERIGELEKAREGAYASLADQVREMSELQMGLRKETGELARALRQPGGRGRWGDMQLRRVVELAGMQEYCDFDVPTAPGDEEVEGMNPDLIVKLPDGQRVFIDAQAPMDAFLESIEADDEDARELAGARHARQIAEYIQKLGPDGGEAPFELAPEFSVLFFPGEAVFSTALAHDPELVEMAAARGVILASPSTLIALLRAVAVGWRQDAIAVNARAISDVGRELHDRVALMTDQFARVGRSLDTTVRNYNKTLRTVESNVIPSARKLEDLGTAAPESIAEVHEVARYPRLPHGLSSLPVSDEAAAASSSILSEFSDDDWEGFGAIEPAEEAQIPLSGGGFGDTGNEDEERDSKRAANDLRAAVR